VDLAGRPTLLIGGTASVVGEDSRHAGDFDAQLDETLVNLEALIAAADASPDDRRTALHRLVELQVYVRSAEQAERAREKLASACPRARGISVALAHVCRRELLIEIEGVAEL
jgi:chorismate lyase/3-hydroxybenzoate synthase